MGLQSGEGVSEIEISSLLRKVLKLPHTTNSELLTLAELWFCSLIVSVYTFSIMVFPPAKETMFDKMLELARGYTAIEEKYTGFQNYLAE